MKVRLLFLSTISVEIAHARRGVLLSVRLIVSRYDANRLAATLGCGFELIDTRRNEHTTPGGVTQKFQFSTFRRERDG